MLQNLNDFITEKERFLGRDDVYFLLKKLTKAEKQREEEGGDELNYHSTTALVHEVYLKLSKSRTQLLTDCDRELIRELTSVVRSVVIDLVRKKTAQKRQGDEFFFGATIDYSTFMKVEKVISQLETQYPAQVQAAQLRYFGDMSVSEIADVMALCDATVHDYLKFFRSLVRLELVD